MRGTVEGKRLLAIPNLARAEDDVTRLESRQRHVQDVGEDIERTRVTQVDVLSVLKPRADDLRDRRPSTVRQPLRTSGDHTAFDDQPLRIRHADVNGIRSSAFAENGWIDQVRETGREVQELRVAVIRRHHVVVEELCDLPGLEA